MGKNKLTEKQKRFCDEYLIDLNSTQAAIRAGYSKKTAEVIGFENLRKPNIAKYIQGRIDKLQQRTEVTQDMIIKELAIIGFSDLADYINIDENTGVIIAKTFDEMEGNKSRALQSITENRAIKEDAKGEQVTVYDKVSFKLHDKIKALELLGKHLGLWNDKLEINGNINIMLNRIITEIKPDELNGLRNGNSKG